MQNRRKTTRTETDHYKVLDLPSGMQGTKLTQKQIKKAYKRKALQLHPDKRPNNPNANAEFQNLQFSYATLMDPHARTIFDRSLLTRSDDKPSSSSSSSSSSSKPKKKTRKKNRYDDMPFTFTNIVRETHRCVIGMGLVWSALKIHAVVGGVAGGYGVCFCYSIAVLLLAYEVQLQRLNEREYDDDEDIDVDESVTKAAKLDVRPVIRQASSKAISAAQKAPKTACAAAKSAYTKYEPKAEECATATWRKLNELPVFPKVAEVVVPAAAYCSEKYNETVQNTAEKGYKVAAYMPLVPTERIAKVFGEKVPETEPVVVETDTPMQ